MTENIQEEIEDKVIDLIALGSSGRLVVFKPEDSGKDLVIERKGDYKNRNISLNVYAGEFHNDKDLEGKIFQLIKEKNTIPEDNFYLMFVRFDVVKQDIADNFFMIPSSELEEPTGKKSFTKFLMGKKDFVRFLIGETEKE